MNPDITSLFYCLACGHGDLSLDDVEYANDRVYQGKLICSECGHVYPITEYVPRFINLDSISTKKQKHIAENFGDAWVAYAKARKVNPYMEEQFRDWVLPLQPDDFKDKMVMEMGSGLGGFSAYSAQYGAKQVIGLEISHALDAGVSMLMDNPNLSFIQADLLEPPIKKESIDLVFSLGVLHHLPKPAEGFNAIVPLAKQDKGQVFIWVYGWENNRLIRLIVEPLRAICHRLPVMMVRLLLAVPLSCILFPLLHTVYHPGLPWPLKGLSEKLPHYHYFQWLRRYGFGYVVGMVNDQLIPPVTHYLKKETLLSWYEDNNIALDSMTHRNKMSWRVLGHRSEG